MSTSHPVPSPTPDLAEEPQQWPATAPALSPVKWGGRKPAVGVDLSTHPASTNPGEEQ
jgi:hypothetical protein